MLSYDCQIRVWYKHTDQMGICHHSNYICYYEAARSELLRYLGMSFAEVEKRGIMMPILEVQSKYHRPAYYDATGLHPQRYAPPVPLSGVVHGARRRQMDGGVEAAVTLRCFSRRKGSGSFR